MKPITNSLETKRIDLSWTESTREGEERTMRLTPDVERIITKAVEDGWGPITQGSDTEIQYDSTGEYIILYRRKSYDN